MEWQKMTAIKLQLDQAQIDKLSLKLGTPLDAWQKGAQLIVIASTYILAEKYMDALNAYKEILKLPLAQEKQKRLDLLGEMAVAMKHCSPVRAFFQTQLDNKRINVFQTFSQVERHFSEYLSLAEQLGRLTEQREALVELLELHRAYRYTDQARILDARLRRIDSLIESAQKDTLSVCFSILF